MAEEEKSFESNENEGSLKDEKFLQEKELECAKAKMIEAREENQKLRRSLSQIKKDYQTLQMQYNDIIAREAFNVSKTDQPCTQNHQETHEPDHLISLSLGRTSSSIEKVLTNEVMVNEGKEGEKGKERLSLGLNSKYDISSDISVMPSPEGSLELSKGEGVRELSKKSGSTLRCDDDEISQQNPTKRTRVSVRVRCDTPTLNDGCQWRKYGQKISKGNPCPRAYYRCTVGPSCPVRKQVQRCAQDMSILITTYEGTHNHPIPPSAIAIASTTSAAASMLLSGSSTSSSYGATSSSNFLGLNFNPSNILSNSKQFHIPNTYSTSSTNPMITLDLTNSSSSSSIFNTLNYLSTPNSSTNLNFSSLESNPLPSSWGGVHQIGNSLNFGGQYSTPEQNISKPFMQNPNPDSQQQTLRAEAVAAATKAITSDPGFQSALVTALSSFVGNRGNGKNNIEAYPGVSNLPPTSTHNGFSFSSSYLNRNPNETGGQQGNMALFQPQLPNVSTPKSKSSSPSDEDTP